MYVEILILEVILLGSVTLSAKKVIKNLKRKGRARTIQVDLKYSIL